MDFFAVKVDKVTESDAIVGTLLEKTVFATENYTSFSLFPVRERIRREFLLLKTCQINVYSMPCPLVPTMTSLPVTILTAKKFTKMIFLNDKTRYIYIYIYLHSLLV